SIFNFISPTNYIRYNTFFLAYKAFWRSPALGTCACIVHFSHSEILYLQSSDTKNKYKEWERVEVKQSREWPR
ncbi:unnamed protein product, partial [Callosobruchus maculatus]